MNDTTAKGLLTQEHVVFTEFDAGEGVLVDLNTKKYFQLNETAVVVWRGLEEGLSPEEIVGRFTSAYDVEEAHAAESVRKAIENFRALKLVRER
jgi:Coenzyme PQQ synthesis protein D (PqqD)